MPPARNMARMEDTVADGAPAPVARTEGPLANVIRQPCDEQVNRSKEVQGVGAALQVPNSLAIIGASFEEERRGKAIGTWTSAFSAALVLRGKRPVGSRRADAPLGGRARPPNGLTPARRITD